MVNSWPCVLNKPPVLNGRDMQVLWSICSSAIVKVYLLDNERMLVVLIICAPSICVIVSSLASLALLRLPRRAYLLDV